MTKIPLFTSDWRRSTPKEAFLKVQNRYFEQNPNNQEDGVALITRPGFDKYLSLSEATGETIGRVYALYHQEGIFGNATFITTDVGVILLDVFDNAILLSLPSLDTWTSNIPFTNQACFVAGIGDVPSYFYVTDGFTLYVTAPRSFAESTLTRTGTVEEGAVVRIGSTYYKFTSGSVDTGTPTGDSASPWLVNLSSAINNLLLAINAQGTPGTDYSTSLTKNPEVNAESTLTPGVTLTVYSTSDNESSNSIVTSVSGSSTLAWSGATLSGGNLSPTRLYQVPTAVFPSGYNIASVVSYDSYVLIAVNGTDTPGRFFWIEPGSTSVDALNFATAETSPDPLVSMRVANERLFLIGSSTIECWYATADNTAPFRQTQGGTFSVGAIAGSDFTIKDTIFFVSESGIIYALDGSGYKAVSDPSISNRIELFLSENYSPFDLTGMLRSWAFDLQDHVFYVLNLGVESTLVFDAMTQQFSVWGNKDSIALDQHAGIFWKNKTYVGDIQSDTLWTLNPESVLDEDKTSTTGNPLFNSFLAVVTGGLPMRLRETLPVNQVYLTGAVGYFPYLGITFLVDVDGGILLDTDGSFLVVSQSSSYSNANPLITLETSDDNGVTWFSHEPIFLTGEYDQEIVWRSLGRVFAPGKLFRISDYSLLPRIDGLDVS